MPIRVNNAVATGAVDYGNPFVNAPTGYRQLACNIANLTTAEVDSKGYIKPGVPLKSDGALVSGASQVIEGVIPEATKVAASNAAGDLTAAGTQQITIATIGQVNKKVIEDNLGRVVSANEIAAFAAAGCLVKLLS